MKISASAEIDLHFAVGKLSFGESRLSFAAGDYHSREAR
jgi:hypothetical protein